MLELEISRRIARDGTNNRANGFESITLQSAVMYYDMMFYKNISFALEKTQYNLSKGGKTLK